MIKVLSSQSGYNLAAGDYDKKEKYLNSFEKGRLLPILCHSCESRNLSCLYGKKVLDAGAGTGRLAIELARRGADVTALDISEEMLKALKRKGRNIKTVVGDVEGMPFENESFDLVVSAFVIAHLKNPITFFDEVYRVLKGEGKFLVTNINQKKAPEVETKNGAIKIESYYHRPEKIRGLLEELAFTIEEEIFVKEGENWVNQILVARK